MTRIAHLAIGMRVVTPTGAIAKVLGMSINTGEGNFSRVRLQFLDPELESEPLQAKLLKPYIGPPVVFEDEKAELQARDAAREG